MNHLQHSNDAPYAMDHPAVVHGTGNDEVRRWYLSQRTLHRYTAALRWAASILIILGTLVAIIGPTARAATPDTLYLTDGTFNGRYWQQCSATERMLYVRGYGDAMGMVGMVMRDRHPHSDVNEVEANLGYVAGFTTGEIIRELDVLYGATENLNIPLPAGMMYVGAKLGGKRTPTELAQVLVKIRGTTAAPPTK